MDSSRPRRYFLTTALLVLAVLVGLLLWVLWPTGTNIAPIDGGLVTQFSHRMDAAVREATAGRNERALDLYEAIVKDAALRIEELSAAHLAAKEAFANDDFPEAVERARKYCKQFLAHKKDDSRLLRAAALAKQGRMERSARMYLDVIEANDLTPPLRQYLIQPRIATAALHRRIGELDKAQAIYRDLADNALQLWQRTEARIYLGEVLLAQDDVSGALEQFLTATNMAAKDAALRVEADKHIARLRRQLGQFAEAEQLLLDSFLAPGLTKSQADLIEAELFGSVDRHAEADEETGGPTAAAEVYLHAAREYTHSPDWAPRWQIKAARAFVRAERFDLARLHLGRIERTLQPEIDSAWFKARLERDAVDEAEQKLGTGSFIGRIRADVEAGVRRCVIVDAPIERDAVWSPDQGDVIVDGRITLATGTSLTIRPGTIVRFTINSCLIVYGTLRAEGLPDATITFEFASSQPSPFDWGRPEGETELGGLQFVGQPGGTGSALRHCIVRFAAVGILCQELSPLIEDCEISSTGHAAIVISLASSPTLSRCTVQDNDGDGIVANGASAPVIRGTNVARSGRHGLAFGTDCQPELTDLSVEHNKGDGVVFFDSARGTLADSVITENEGAGIRCDTNSAPTIAHCRITDNRNNGVLAASNSKGRFRDCLIASNAPCGVHCETASPTFTTCTITGNRDCGVLTTLNAAATLNQCTIAANPVGMAIDYVSLPEVRNCSLGNNLDWNVVHTSESDLDLSGNWWSSTDAKAIRGTISLLRMPGAARVVIEPILTAAPPDVAPLEPEETP